MRSVTLDSKITGAILLTALAAGACNTTKSDNGGYTPSGATTTAPTPGPQPNFTTQAVTLDNAPPPISGGTLTLGPDGHTVVAADSDRDRIYVVDIPSRTIKHDIALGAGAEPGRVAIDSHNVAHVALRGTGSLVSVDLATGAKTERRICAAPRGVVFDKSVDSLHVACAEGVLATISLKDGTTKRLNLDGDLRDVMVNHDRLFISHFRSAKINVVTRDGEVIGTSSVQGGNLGWRMAAGPTGEDDPDVALVSQDPQNPAPTPGGVGYYGSGALDACNSPTITSTRLDIPGQAPILIPPAVLPVDLATNGKGEYAIVAAGNGHTQELPQIFIHNVKTQDKDDDYSSSSGYYSTGSYSAYGTNPDCLALGKGFVPGQAVAAVYDGDNQLIVQSREPAALYIMSPDRKSVAKEITLSAISREDSGHAIFHSNSGGFLACASCHAEGGEDGRTWEFVEGQRRTPTMRGTVANTAPYHWDGAMKDVRMLVDHVFSTRMSGPKVDDAHVGTLQTWLFKLPPPPKLDRDAAAVARGRATFESRGCTTCHSGTELTNNTTLDVGTGGSFQVPSLVGVTWRAPYLHTGCAKTLKDRFSSACGGDKHGNVDGLATADLDDLTTYLESL